MASEPEVLSTLQPLKKVGGSHMIALPPSYVRAQDLRENSSVRLTVAGAVVTLEPVRDSVQRTPLVSLLEATPAFPMAATWPKENP